MGNKVELGAMIDRIIVKGAREHNLKNIDVEIPKNKLVVFTGVSGSGKSSLAFDTIYAEGQRRYVESLSSYARQFLGVMPKPDVDLIEGLSPAISIDQKTTSHNPRSTVGTITEIYDYLRLLYARIGIPHCPKCGREVGKQSAEKITDQIMDRAPKRFFILAPLVKGKKGEFDQLFSNLRAQGYARARIDGQIYDLNDDFSLLKNNKHDIEAVIDRVSFTFGDRSRIYSAVETGLRLSDGELIMAEVLDKSLEFPDRPERMEDHLFSQKFACPKCELSFSEIEPRLFSFNAPQGACPTCNGLGFLLKVDERLVINPELSILEGGVLPIGEEVEHDTWFMRMVKEVARINSVSLVSPISQISPNGLKKILYGTEGFEGVIPRLERLFKETQSEWRRFDIEKYMRNDPCLGCHGARLKPEALSVTINGLNIDKLCQMSILSAKNEISKIPLTMVSEPIIKELSTRLQFLFDVGLNYLTLGRSAGTLAGGEAQRIRLASQIGSGLSGVLYVLDEPSIGLHQADNKKLISTLTHLRDLGNTVIVVEHDREMINSSDWVIDFGPLAGSFGGEIIYQGEPNKITGSNNCLTGQYLSVEKDLKFEKVASSPDKFLTVIGARQHNLKNITVKFPIGRLVGVTGVSGSGKSTLVTDTLFQLLAEKFYPRHKERAGNCDGLSGEDYVDKVVLVDQSPIGRTPRSNPATYTGVFTHIRDLFAQTKDARVRGFTPGKFSFNVKGGRCETCQGEGQIKIEMQFLPDVYVDCEACMGMRYGMDALEIYYKEKNIAQVLNLTVDEALGFFGLPMPLVRKLEILSYVGLGYIRLGQPATTLSGGEAQRIKLASELSKKSTGRTVYILDEPTTGLHFYDIDKLLLVLKKLVAGNNTVIVVEHNLDFIKNCDWLIDLGPGGGQEGGEIVAQGTVEQVVNNPQSRTGAFLKEILK